MTNTLNTTNSNKKKTNIDDASSTTSSIFAEDITISQPNVDDSSSINSRTSEQIATIVCAEEQAEQFTALFNKAKTNNYSKAELSKELAILSGCGLCAFLPAMGSYNCGESSAEEVIEFFSSHDSGIFQILYTKGTAIFAGITNFYIYEKNDKAFLGFISGNNIKIFNPKETEYKSILAASLGVSGALASVSVAGVNALGLTELPKWRQTLSFIATTAFNIPLHFMYAINLLTRFLLPKQEAEYARLLGKLSEKLLSKNSSEQVELLKDILVNLEAHNECYKYLSNTKDSDGKKLKYCFEYIKKLPAKEMFILGNALMQKLEIKPETNCNKNIRLILNGLAAMIGIIACLGNYYSQENGETVILSVFTDEETSEAIADGTAWYPFIAKLLMYVSAQLSIKDTLCDTLYLTKLFYHLPIETKAAIIIPTVIALGCFVTSGTCYMLDTYSALINFLNLDYGELTPSVMIISLIANWGATSINTHDFSKFLLNTTICMTNNTLGKMMSWCGYNRDHQPGFTDLSHTMREISKQASTFFKSADARNEIQQFFNEHNEKTHLMTNNLFANHS
ncbi:MAG: hypothetical protein CMF49_04910 [Legionellales bacterium]|nr:hypothetical protein [Legionellales bacterium]